MMPMPRALRSFTTLKKDSTSSKVSAEVGSSKIRILEFRSSPRRISTSVCSAMESVLALRERSISQPISDMIFVSRFFSERVDSLNPMVMFSSTFMFGKSIGSCGTM